MVVSGNGWLWTAVALCEALQLMAVYWPFLQVMLHTTPLSLADWGLVAACSLAPVAVIEVVKFIAQRQAASRARRRG